MNMVLVFFKRYPIVAATIVIGLVAISLNAFASAEAARWLVTVYVALISLWTFVDMVKDIVKGKFGLDILALIAMVSTLLVGEYWASLIIVLMLSGGEALEDFAANRAKKELTSLLDNSPTEAHLVVDDKSDGTIDVPVDQVKVGDVLLVRSSELVPVDSKVLSGTATFDESSLTGESLLVNKEKGDEVPSGAINGDRAVKVEAVRISEDSQFQQIVRLVKEASESKAPIVRLADRYAVPFTIVSLLIGGIAWIISGNPVRFAEVLVLATPCPLLIAAPVAFMGGMSRSARTGIVVKGGGVLEQASRVASAAFDKTGTLTKGSPQVVAIKPAPGITEDDLLLKAASAEQYSSHILAEGIRDEASSMGMQLMVASEAYEATAQGVVATIDGAKCVIGQFDFVKEAAPDAHQVDLQPGQVAVYAAENGRYFGAIVLSDEVRPESKEVIAWLKNNQIESITMLTGDAKQTAESIAQEIGISDVRSRLSPGDKVNAVKELGPKPTLMVGDGVNDAPVLAVADVGVAMGARGSTTAGEAADAVILKDSLEQIPYLISISRHTVKVALTAIWIGIICSVVLMLVATTGIIPAVVGALLQEVLDLVAILYALRALYGKLPVVGTPQQ